MLPGFTSPPIRMRVPGAICFSARSVGELKKTIESRRAPSTNATAMASTPRLAPIRINRRCLRVISSRAFEPQALYRLQSAEVAILGAVDAVRAMIEDVVMDFYALALSEMLQ